MTNLTFVKPRYIENLQNAGLIDEKLVAFSSHVGYKKAKLRPVSAEAQALTSTVKKHISNSIVLVGTTPIMIAPIISLNGSDLNLVFDPCRDKEKALKKAVAISADAVEKIYIHKKKKLCIIIEDGDKITIKLKKKYLVTIEPIVNALGQEKFAGTQKKLEKI